MNADAELLQEQDPTPQHQWEVTTPAAVYATGLDSEEWLP